MLFYYHIIYKEDKIYIKYVPVFLKVAQVYLDYNNLKSSLQRNRY